MLFKGRIPEPGLGHSILTSVSPVDVQENGMHPLGKD
jgi:hypothetical protein